MTQSQVKSQLSDVLDALWQSRDGHPRELATRLFANLTEDSRLVLLAWATAAFFGPVGGRLALAAPRSFAVSDGWGKPLFSAELGISTEGQLTRPMLSLSDTPWAVFRKSGDYAPSNAHKHSGASLLIAMQVIRDHIDSALLKPFAMRHQEVDGFALQAGVDGDHFRRLAAWISSVQTSL